MSTQEMQVQYAPRELILIRLFDAPRELVFKCWTEPEHLAHWWGPHGFSVPDCSVDLRPGGKLRIVMRAPDGRDYPVLGTFTEVVPPERLAFDSDVTGHPDDWFEKFNATAGHPADNRDALWQFTAIFEAKGGQTLVTMHNRFASDGDRDAFVTMGSKDGWRQMFERLDVELAQTRGAGRSQ